MHRFVIGLGVTILGLCVVPACQRGPTMIPMPRTSPSGAAGLALKKYDTDGNGKIDGKELTNAATFGSALSIFDTNHDQGIDAEEIAARISAWHDSQIPLAPVRITVNWQGKPLVGATVKLIPEDFLGDDFRSADGVTDESGMASMSIPEGSRPTSDAPTGVQFGLYRMEISRQQAGREELPAAYNTASSLGLEVSYNNPRIINPPLIIDLK